MKETIQYRGIERERKERISKLKTLIIKRVPLLKRQEILAA